MTAHSRIEFLKRELADEQPTVGLLWLMLQLGKRHAYGQARQVKYAQLLVDECGCPPPYPTMIGKKGAQTLTHDVAPDSQWPRKAVEIWLEDFLPPANADALEAHARDAAAEEMDSAAEGLLRVVK